jgi:hypothetical protein
VKSILIISTFILSMYVYSSDSTIDCIDPELYKILSTPDAQHMYEDSFPQEDIFKDQSTRRIVSEAYAMTQLEDGHSYTVVGIDIEVPGGGKETAYYLVKLNAGLKISNDRSPYFEVKGDFLGTSSKRELVEKHLSFFPIEYVTNKRFKEYSGALATGKISKTIYKEKDGDFEIDAYAAADIFAYTYIKYRDKSSDFESVDLAKIKVGFRARKGDKLSFGVYIGGGHGFSYDRLTGMKHHGTTSKKFGADISYKISKNSTASLIYEYETSPYFNHKHETIALKLNFKFRGFEYIGQDLSRIFRQMR